MRKRQILEAEVCAAHSNNFQHCACKRGIVEDHLLTTLLLSARYTHSAMFPYQLVVGVSLITACITAADQIHSPLSRRENGSGVQTRESDFAPDYFLSVTYEEHYVACKKRVSVLVNGTSPGPTLRLPGGKTSWIRVCNDMAEYNTTMVRTGW